MAQILYESVPEWLVRKRLNDKNYRERVRYRVIYHYSNGKLVCNCCGLNEYESLSIDHIKGGGKKHREELFQWHSSSRDFYLWLQVNGYPEGYQVLCRRCNSSKGKGKACRLHTHNNTTLDAFIKKVDPKLINPITTIIAALAAIKAN